MLSAQSDGGSRRALTLTDPQSELQCQVCPTPFEGVLFGADDEWLAGKEVYPNENWSLATEPFTFDHPRRDTFDAVNDGPSLSIATGGNTVVTSFFG